MQKFQVRTRKSYTRCTQCAIPKLPKKCCTLGTMLHSRGLHIGCKRCTIFSSLGYFGRNRVTTPGTAPETIQGTTLDITPQVIT